MANTSLYYLSFNFSILYTFDIFSIFYWWMVHESGILFIALCVIVLLSPIMLVGSRILFRSLEVTPPISPTFFIMAIHPCKQTLSNKIHSKSATFEFMLLIRICELVYDLRGNVIVFVILLSLL